MLIVLGGILRVEMAANILIVKVLTCPRGDIKITVVIRPIYVGLDGEQIFVLFFVESE